MGHPADRPRQHGGGREPKKGAESTEEKATPREKKHRKAKETKPGTEANTATAKASGTAREGKAEQTPKHGPG